MQPVAVWPFLARSNPNLMSGITKGLFYTRVSSKTVCFHNRYGFHPLLCPWSQTDLSFGHWISTHPTLASQSKHVLTVQLLHCKDVVPAQDQAAAQLPVVRRHQSMPHGGVLQAQSVSDLMGGHHEQVVALVSIQRPSLRHVEVGFSSARQEGVSQRPTWMSDMRRLHIYCVTADYYTCTDWFVSDWCCKLLLYNLFNINKGTIGLRFLFVFNL